MPSRPSSTPASAGPRSIIDWPVIWLRASPAATWSLGSSRGTKTPAAGAPSAPNAACTATSASTAGTGTCPVNPCTASSREQAACPTVAAR